MKGPIEVRTNHPAAGAEAGRNWQRSGTETQRNPAACPGHLHPDHCTPLPLLEKDTRTLGTPTLAPKMKWRLRPASAVQAWGLRTASWQNTNATVIIWFYLKLYHHVFLTFIPSLLKEKLGAISSTDLGSLFPLPLSYEAAQRSASLLFCLCCCDSTYSQLAGINPGTTNSTCPKLSSSCSSPNLQNPLTSLCPTRLKASISSRPPSLSDKHQSSY